MTLGLVDKLSLALNNPHASRAELLKKVCVYSHQLIPSANLISLWRLDAERDAIVSLVNYDALDNKWSSGIELLRSDYPEYFKSLIENEVIIASDARNYSATRCFNTSYFEPNDIHSLLDFILHKDFIPYGILCCESKGKLVHWSDQDVDNVRTIATLISFFFDVS